MSDRDTVHPLTRSIKSTALTEGPSRAPARAMLKAVGFSDADLHKPLVGIANTWTEIGPCNFHLRRLAAQGEGRRPRSRRHADGVQHRRGVGRHHDGRRRHARLARSAARSSPTRSSWWSRGHHLDAVVLLCGCDKTIPGTLMALARLNLPGVVLYGGSIAPGTFEGHDVTIQDVFEGGRRARGRHDDRRAAARPRGSRLPGRRRLRRPVHRQHDGDGLRVPRRARRSAAPACRRCSTRRTPSRESAGTLAMDLLEARRAAARHPHAARRSRTPSPASSPAAARPTPCCTSSRIAREAGVRARRSTTSTASAIARR